MNGSQDRKLSHDSLQQAAHWYVLLHDERVDSDVQRQWQQWIDQHGEHRDAWHYVERIGQRFGQLHDQDHQRTLSRALGSDGAARLSRRHGIKGMLVLGAGTLLGWSSWRSTPLPRLVSSWTADYATGTGDIREARLADGTRLWLNAESSLDARFDSALRLLHLHFGEVLIDTAKDQRPFFVDSRHGRLQALGTRFSVRQSAQHTLLTVFAGAVQIRTTDSGEVRRIDAGQQAQFDARGIAAPSSASVSREAWTRHMLAAEGMPLSQVLEELASFRHGYLGCHPAVADLSVMGYFPLSDSEQTLRLLQAALPVRIKRLTDWWVSVEPAIART